MGAFDGLGKSELDVPGRDMSRELAIADRPADRSDPPTLDEPRSRGEVYAEHRQRVEGGWEPRPFEAPRAELGRFDPERAGLPPMTLEAAASYIEQHKATRPWLATADKASPEARWIIAAMDAGDGHGHIRHGCWVTEEDCMRRAAYLEDPAQLDPWKRYLGIDGLRPNEQPHRCRTTATRITDPDAFATAFARGIEQPSVRGVLEMPLTLVGRPHVTVPITTLLGSTGHGFCTGWRLEPVDGSMDTARANRSSWLKARAEGRTPDVPQPQARPVPTFEGGVMTFLFARNFADKRFEIATMFPRPPGSN